jgi:hypothetical protein
LGGWDGGCVIRGRGGEEGREGGELSCWNMAEEAEKLMEGMKAPTTPASGDVYFRPGVVGTEWVDVGCDGEEERVVVV